MQRLIVSMMRFSTAMTLYGFERLQSSMKLVQSEQERNQEFDRMQSAIDSLSNVLVDNLGDRNKETLSSITSMAKNAAQRFPKDLSFMDPRETIKAATRMIERSTESLAGRAGNAASIEEEEPKPAADILS